jgi:hypothetical protein
MKSKYLILLLAFILAAWMAPPLAAETAPPATAGSDGAVLPEGQAEDEDALERRSSELSERRMDALGLFNLLTVDSDAELDTNETKRSAQQTGVRVLAEQAAADNDPVIAYYGAAALAVLEGRALPEPPPELGGPRVPIEIPAGVSFTEATDWEAFLNLSSELQSESVDIRIAALNGLINLASATRPEPAPEVVAELQKLLADGDPQVAEMAFRALAALAPPDARMKITNPLGRLASEDELYALVDAALGEGRESPEERLLALEALLEAASMTPLAEDPEVLRAFEISSADADPRIAYSAQLALRGGLDGDPDALAGTWVSETDPSLLADYDAGYTEQPPSLYEDAAPQEKGFRAEGDTTDVYVNPDPPPFDPGDQPPSPTDRAEVATYEEVAPGVWVNTMPPPVDPGAQQQRVENE